MKIEVNGRSYDSWDDVPDDVRRLVGGVLPDADGDGVPDLLAGRGPLPEGSHTFTSTSYTIDGRTYDSLDAVPPDLREALQRMQGSFLRDGKGRPVVVRPGAASPSGAVPAAQAPQATQTPPASPATDQVMLNGVPVDVDAATGRSPRRRWWNRRRD